MLISILPDRYEPDIKTTEEWDLEDCYNAFKCFESSNKDKKTAWSFTAFELKPDQVRLNSDNVSKVHALVLDLDTCEKLKPSIKRTYEKLRFLDLKFLLYTTHAHTDESPRFRVILPFATPMTKIEYAKNKQVYQKMFSTLDVDPSSYNMAKHFYLPGPNAKYILYTEGQDLISKIKPTASKSYTNKTNKNTMSNPQKYVENSEGFYEGNRNNWVSQRIYAMKQHNVSKDKIFAIMMPYIEQLSKTEQNAFNRRINNGK